MITKTVVRTENQLNGLSYGFANALFAVVNKLRRNARIERREEEKKQTNESV